jgi:hypothetical protein
MAAFGGGLPPPTASDAFNLLLRPSGSKPKVPAVANFIKKLESIPEIDLPGEIPIKVALALADRGLVGQFMGLWPSTKTTDDWIQRNWRPQLKNSVTCYPVGRGFFIFEFIAQEDRDLIFRNGPYFMGAQGLYLNRWTPDFNAETDVPTEVPVWVRLPNLPIHCWNSPTLEKIGNSLGKYIDKADNKGQYSCARICVEVDLEAGLPEAIKLKIGEWAYYQKLDYEQIPFKCRQCHEHGHFQRNCPKNQVSDEDAGWQKVKKGKAIPKNPEKIAINRQNQPSSSNKPSCESTKEGPIKVSSTTERPEPILTEKMQPTTIDVSRLADQSNRKDTDVLNEDLLEPGELPSTQEGNDNPSSSKEAKEDPQQQESDPEEDSDGETSSDLHSLQIKTPRGRKSKKKQREEATYLEVLEGSQKTLKGIMNTRSKKGTTQASKEAKTSPHLRQ